MKYTKGFTLIELIITMIIIAIVGATALPKFISLKYDANAADSTNPKGPKVEVVDSDC